MDMESLRKEKIKEFFKLIKPDLTNLGFKRKGQSYFRFVNGQIWQEFNIQRSIYGESFTMNTTINPIFCGGGSQRIGFYINGEDIWWNYNCDINEVVKIVNEKMIPLFEKITTYDRLYEIIKPFVIIDKSSANPFNRRNVNKSYVQLFDSFSGLDLFWLCARYKNIDACDKYIDIAIEIMQMYLDNSGDNDSTDSEYQNKFKKQFDVLKRYKNSLKNNFDELLNFIDEMEQEMLLSLSTSQ